MDKEQLLSRNALNIAEFRQTEGRPQTFGSGPVLLLTTVGARSGQMRTSPLMYLPDDREKYRVFVFAAYAGADVDPDWYRNILAHPDRIQVEIGAETWAASAQVVSEPRRSDLYDEQARRVPRFAEYQAKTSRTIPVIEITLLRLV